MASASLAELRERLAAPGLGLADLMACADALAGLAAQAQAAGQPVRRIALAGDLTLDFLQRAIACALAQDGELAVFHVAATGTLRQACLDPGSALHAFRPDAVVLVPDWRQAIVPLPPDTPAADVAAGLAAQVREHAAVWSALQARGCIVLQHLFVPPHRRGRGVAERLSPASMARRVRALNEALMEAAAGSVHWVEADRLAESVGLAAWAPDRFHFAGRLVCDPRHLPAYLPWFCGAWRAATGRTRKVLALDLDDTLWGGTIGDDGVEGIVLGPDHGPRGEAFADWQAYLAGLARRGVVLAVCSKNSAELAAPGLTHPAGALRREHFAAFVCRWDDKAAGLRDVAAAIGVGLDSLVFADDNPAECALVRALLPEVAVVDLGSDPAQFVARLEAGHWFDLAAYTPADLQRTASYAAREQSRAAQSAATDLDAYLRGLGLVGRLAPAQGADLPRLAQLELKTNQFNLTTRRISQAQLAEWLHQPQRLVLALHLRDRFGDHGLVGALVAVVDGEVLRIDSWLLSCRVFARTAEHFMLARLAQMGRALGATALVADYRATPRNGVVADLLPRLGFRPEPGGRGGWRRSLAQPLDDLVSYVADEAA